MTPRVPQFDGVLSPWLPTNSDSVDDHVPPLTVIPPGFTPPVPWLNASVTFVSEKSSPPSPVATIPAAESPELLKIVESAIVTSAAKFAIPPPVPVAVLPSISDWMIVGRARGGDAAALRGAAAGHACVEEHERPVVEDVAAVLARSRVRR